VRLKELGYRDPNAHQTGKKIVNIPAFVERFPFGRLCATLQKYVPEEGELDVADSGGRTELEGRLLREYLVQYGDSPPLNG
jgi:hypothetical protein